MLSINLTIHNKEKILYSVLSGIFKNVTLPFEFIAVLDGCTDESEKILLGFINSHSHIPNKIIYANNIFETRSNNLAAKSSIGDYICIIQDDMVIKEKGFDERMIKPFKAFSDVAAVTANCSHNWVYNYNNKGVDANGWSDLLHHIEHANKTNTDRNTFAVRDCANRGPLMIKHEYLQSLGYFDEAFAPQDSDDHNFCYEVKKKLGKVVGYYGIDYESQPSWGGTRNEDGSTKQWMLDANVKNASLLYERHKDVMNTHTIENRKLC